MGRLLCEGGRVDIVYVTVPVFVYSVCVVVDQTYVFVYRVSNSFWVGSSGMQIP